MALAPDIAGFSRLITALDPWLDRVVIVGGWAHRLYHLHPSAQKLDFAPLMTLDADVALPPTLPAQTPTIRDALVANGFEEEFRGNDMPPATLYHLGDKDSGFYAEFLTPLTGSEYTRTGRVRPGLHSKAVKTVETAHTWLFGEMTDVIRVAASIAADRRLTPEAVRESCQYGLQQIMR